MANSAQQRACARAMINIVGATRPNSQAVRRAARVPTSTARGDVSYVVRPTGTVGDRRREPADAIDRACRPPLASRRSSSPLTCRGAREPNRWHVDAMSGDAVAETRSRTCPRRLASGEPASCCYADAPTERGRSATGSRLGRDGLERMLTEVVPDPADARRRRPRIDRMQYRRSSPRLRWPGDT